MPPETARTYLLLLALTVLPPASGIGQTPFDAAEYLDLLSVAAATHTKGADTLPGVVRGESLRHVRLYRSPETGLKNRWELWMREDGTAVVSLRGTVQHADSWLENFYAAMVPAAGSIRTADGRLFEYRLAADARAAVHAGWTLGLAHLAPDILARMDTLIRRDGVKRFIVAGHSQGAAIAYLLTSLLHYRREAGQLPADLSIRTYCSAPPKPGNMYYAYDFDFITRDGRAHAVVNSADWVPETPGSLQTSEDIRPDSPIRDATLIAGRQRWPVGWILKAILRKLIRSTAKGNRVYARNFGRRAHSQVRRRLPQLEMPAFTGSFNYSRAGTQVVLVPDEGYHAQFSKDPKNYFNHHGLEPYRYLVKKYYGEKGR